MKGAGTNDDTLIRIIVSRCEVDMVQICKEFRLNYKQTLAQFITADTSGDYRKLLLLLVGDNVELQPKHTGESAQVYIFVSQKELTKCSIKQ